MKIKYLNPIYCYNNRRFITRFINNKKLKGIHFLHNKNIPLSLNELKVLSYRNKHKGKRAFIIGNGPSLKIDDLNKLKNEITFASNRIYLAFDQTEWRPTYYTVIDIMVAKNYCNEINKLNLHDKFYSKKLRNYLKKNGIYLNLIELPYWQKHDFSDNLLIGHCPGETVIFTQLELAYYMGIKEIYLIGIDFDFKISKEVNEKSPLNEVLLEQNDEQNHFHPDYRRKGEKWTYPKLTEQKEAFQFARDFLNKKNIQVKNASRKSKLDVFKKVNFDKLF